jgi:uracil-DNA glycosylase
LENGAEDIFTAVRDKLLADLRDLRKAVAACSSCAGGAKGIPGKGQPGADIFFLAGMPGPGAARDNPWGSWRELLLAKVSGEWGWDLGDAYFSTAIRCRLQRVSRREVRRCAGFLAEEFFTVGPRLMIASGRVAAVALREALGDGIPGDPRAGDVCDLYSTRILFALDVARVDREEEAAALFWKILREAEDLFPQNGDGVRP